MLTDDGPTFLVRCTKKISQTGQTDQQDDGPDAKLPRYLMKLPQLALASMLKTELHFLSSLADGKQDNLCTYGNSRQLKGTSDHSNFFCFADSKLLVSKKLNREEKKYLEPSPNGPPLLLGEKQAA